MQKIKITLPDGSVKEYSKGITAGEIAFDIGKRLGNDAVAAKINGHLKDLGAKIGEDSKLVILTIKDKEGLEAYRHSLAHLLAAAVMELYPNTKRTIGPAIENGFYYDFKFENPVAEEDLPKIEKKMREILPNWDRFERHELSAKDAKKEYTDNPFKHEMIDEFSKDGNKVSFYKSGEYWDLCRGGHLSSMKKVDPNSFKLTHIAGAYWRGSEKNPQLTRIYAAAFPTKKELDDFLKLQEEAKKRDHRKLGKELDFFSIHEEGPGFIFFHPKGVTIINELMALSRKLNLKYGYQEIKTPLILSRKLWEQSGHWEHYRENMYFTEVDGQSFAVKPMNCPGSILVYGEKLHSYREFPLRLAEYGNVHRHELSGVLSGLFRVRSFTQDDVHIYIAPSMIEDEVKRVIDRVDTTYKIFGFSYHVELSTMPEKSMGSKEIWDVAESALKAALKSKGMDFRINEGEGAFYGPKIDFHIKDCIGRTWQCATIQVDFQMPEKFELVYIGEDGDKHTPVIIHSVAYGSIERFFGILIEHFAGKFPLWLSPVQARILTVADRFNDYAESVRRKYEEAGLRVEIDSRSESISYKVRDAQLAQVNYILVVGEKEIGEKTVTVRTRDSQILGAMKIEEFLRKAVEEARQRG